jgi:cytochrome c oxidase assembly factor CtaG
MTSGRSRIPRLAVAAWTVAAAVIAALVVAVSHYLSTGSSMGGMAMGQQFGAADALSRASTAPLRPLLGSALITAWQLDAVALAVIVVAAAAYLTGVALVPVRSPGSRWPIARTVSFLAGLAVCAYATNGSIAVYDQVLFTAHMVGHLALVMVAPALLVAGRPLTLTLAASSPGRRERLARIARGRVVSLLTAPPVALASYAVVIVGSHLTGIMNEVMRHTWAGQLEHLVYLLVGLQFFALIVGDEPIRWRLAAPARWLLLAVAMAVDTFTGVVLLQGTRPVGMLVDPKLPVDALSDTRTGGAIMWFGGDAIMAVIMIILVVGWLRRADVRVTDESGWLERTRRATFAERTGGVAESDDGTEFDEDDAARASYNAWLAQLERKN